MPPIATHVWRQTDSASFAWTYWQNELKFFQPRVMNISQGDGKAASEFPIFHFITAILYSIFGFKHSFLKAIHLSIYFFGIFSVFKIARHYLKSNVLSIVISLLFFVAPTLVFYGNNYIPDVPALSFGFIGFAALLKSNSLSNKKYLLILFISFCMAGLLKATYLMPLIAFVLSKIIIEAFIEKKEGVRYALKFTGFLITILFVVALWVLFLKMYNPKYKYPYFLAGINPIWGEGTNASDIQYIFERTYTEWANSFFHKYIHYLFLISFITLPFSFKLPNKELPFTTLFLTIGITCYYILWFAQFMHHDYYTIPFYALFLFSLLNFLNYLSSIFKQNLLKSVSVIVLLVMIFFSAKHTKENINNRLNEAKQGPWAESLWNKNLRGYVNGLGINDNDIIIAVPDFSPQVSLYLIGRKGYTEFHEKKYDKEKFLSMKERGVKYVFTLNSTEYDEIVKDIANKIGQFETIGIYAF